MKRWVVSAWIGLLVAAAAGGSTFLHVSRSELAAKAAAVVVGRVLEVNSFWTASGRIIETEAMVAIDEVRRQRERAPAVPGAVQFLGYAASDRAILLSSALTGTRRQSARR